MASTEVFIEVTCALSPLEQHSVSQSSLHYIREMKSVMHSPPAYPSETMPSAISHTRIKSRTKVSSQRRLWPGKWSQVLWWMWTFELWLPHPATTTRSIVMIQGGGNWIRRNKESCGMSGQWSDGMEIRMRRQFNLEFLRPTSTLYEKKNTTNNLECFLFTATRTISNFMICSKVGLTDQWQLWDSASWVWMLHSVSL